MLFISPVVVVLNACICLRFGAVHLLLELFLAILFTAAVALDGTMATCGVSSLSDEHLLSRPNCQFVHVSISSGIQFFANAQE